MPLGELRISDGVRHGPQMRESELPNTTAAGTPKAAAICAGPESLPTNSDAPEVTDISSLKGGLAKVRHARNGARSSPAPPTKMGCKSKERSRACATSQNRSAGQVFRGSDANG